MIIKFIKNSLIIILVTISLIISLEFLFFTLYNITGSKYFESNFELRKRYNIVRPYDEKNFITELNSNKIKVAIFGGSSSNGHGTQINFGEFLENLSSNKYLIHNYAKNGAPFVDFQSDILQLVSPYYDILIIYAGHNEIWSHLYGKSYLLNQNIELFNGHIVNGRKIRFEHNLEISLLEKIIQSQNNMYFWILNSRLLSFYKKVIIFMNKKIKSTNQNKNVKEIRYPLFVNKAIISESDKKEISSKYFLKINEIEKSLRINQKLILSTVLSNDLYPPNLDVIDNEKITSLSKIFSKIYQKLENKEIINEAMIESLPNGAHKEYIKGKSCVIKSENLNLKWDHCKPILANARSLDVLPYRVIDKINLGIINWKGKAETIDPFKNLPSTSNNYLEYFVDFQHPSIKGHYLIAKELFKVLNIPFKEIDIDKINDRCGNFSWCELTNSYLGNCLDIKKKNKEKFLKAVDKNIKWLSKRVETSPLPQLHKYYLNKNKYYSNICSLN